MKKMHFSLQRELFRYMTVKLLWKGIVLLIN